jgi:aminoglycoside 3-N-acetyltransferase
MITSDDVARFVGENNLSGSIICLHSSFKSFGGVKATRRDYRRIRIARRDARLSRLFLSSVTRPDRRITRGTASTTRRQSTCRASATSTRPNRSSRAWLRSRAPRPARRFVRTLNPLNGFVVRGRYADALTNGQSPLNAYSVYKNIRVMGVPSFVALAGVDFTSCTPIHYAEELAGKGLFRRWAVYRGKTVEVEVGACSDGFEKLRPFTHDIERTARLGESFVRIYEFTAFIDLVARVIAERLISRIATVRHASAATIWPRRTASVVKFPPPSAMPAVC